MKQAELNNQTYFYFKLFVAKSLLLNPENFFNIFDGYVDKHNLDEKQIAKLRAFENKEPRELVKIINNEIEKFITGKQAEQIINPLMVKYAYQYQRNNFIDKISEYLKRYNKRIPLHPEEDTALFGENKRRITFFETLIALEYEELISIISLQLDFLNDQQVILPQSKLDTIFSPSELKSSRQIPIVTIQPTRKLINLVEPNLSYQSYRLSFKGKEIPIPEGNQDALCKLLLKNKKTMSKRWSWDEIVEKWGGDYEDKEGWRKVYGTGNEINKKIALDTGINDLFIVKTKTIMINPKYLPLQRK